MSIEPRSSCSIIGQTVVGPQSSYSTIGQTVVIGPISNWPITGQTVVSHSQINMGGIKRQEVEGETAAEVIVAAVWFIGCRKSAKGCY